MISMGAVYAKIPSDGASELDEAVKKARAVGRHFSPLGVLAFDTGCHHYAVVDRWGRFDYTPIWSECTDFGLALELIELSREVGEVVAFFEIDEGRTMGIYDTCRGGELVRDLLWCDNSWTKVDGEPQAWEKPLFRGEPLDTALQNARDFGDDEPVVKNSFDAGRLVQGASFQIPDSLSGQIWKVLSGPGYGFSPWQNRRDLVDKIRAENVTAKRSG